MPTRWKGNNKKEVGKDGKDMGGREGGRGQECSRSVLSEENGPR